MTEEAKKNSASQKYCKNACTRSDVAIPYTSGMVNTDTHTQAMWLRVPLSKKKNQKFIPQRVQKAAACLESRDSNVRQHQKCAIV